MIAAELRGGSKPSLNEALGWIGSRVDDIYGANVGRLEDVWIDPGTGVPRWLLVKEGRFGGHTTLIPFEDATAGAGHVWVPYEREVVREAPEIEPGAPLTHGVEASLRNHYATKAPALYAGRETPIGAGQPPPSGTATVRLHGNPLGGPPGGPAQPASPPSQPAPAPQPPPQRGAIRGEQPHRIPPYQLPARPAPPVAPPPRQTSPEPRQPQVAQQPPQPEPPADWRAPRQGWQQAAPPPQQPAAPQPPPVASQQPQRSWAPPPVQQAPPDPIASLQDLASQPGVNYVEIELSGELSIRGELRSVRVVPR